MAAFAGIPEVEVGEYYDAIDCMAKPEDGNGIDKGVGLRSLGDAGHLPSATIDTGWNLVAPSEPKEGLDKRAYVEQMKLPHLQGTGGFRLVRAVTGGDNFNDVPMLDEAVFGISFRDCKPGVISHASHLVHRPVETGDKAFYTEVGALGVLREANRLLRVMKHAA